MPDLRDSARIRAAVVRGGTSKGVFLLADDLPADPVARDETILAIFGSPDPRQIDGLGGADPLTSKVAIVSRSARADADVDYTFGYVAIDDAVVDYQGNCGNISMGVGPFALDEGLVPGNDPTTTVRIFNTNTEKIIVADVPVSGGRARAGGDHVLQGIPATGARIELNFVDSAGSKTGALLPTGNVIDRMRLSDRRVIRVSLVDAASPAAFVQAVEIGFTGAELPGEMARKPESVSLLEEIRVRAAVMMNLARDPELVSPAVPKVAFVAVPMRFETIHGEVVTASEVDLVARTKALDVLHKAYAVTGGICLSAAARIEGTVVHEVTRPPQGPEAELRVGHPSGVSVFDVRVTRMPSGRFEVTRASLAGTARRIMDGHVYVPYRAGSGRSLGHAASAGVAQ